MNPHDMIEIRDTGEGLFLGAKVQPKASANKIVGEHAGALKINVTAPPEKGKANAAVIALLSKELGVPKSSIEIVAGETCRIKTLRIRGLAKEALSRLLERTAKTGEKRGL